MDNLEKDSAEALRLGYGVHYGHYKADHPHTTADEPDPEAAPEQTRQSDNGAVYCKECGKRFLPVRKGNIYCTKACGARQRARERWREKHNIEEV